MKNALFTLALIVFNISIYAQDNIILKNGYEIKAKVEEIGVTEIKYKKFENLNGPTYSILKSEVLMIRYENGTKDIFNQDDNIVNKQTTINSIKSNNDSCLIIIYREKLFRGAMRYILYADDKEIAIIKNGSYYEYKHTAGEVEFWAKTEVKEFVKITLEAGKTYYLECSDEFGVLVRRPHLLFVDKLTAEKKLSKLKK